MSRKKTQHESGGVEAPSVDRPKFPSIYGVPQTSEGLQGWKHVSERLEKALIYWVSTVDPFGRPHATPVDGLWIDETLYFGGDPGTRRQRNLAANPAVCIHLESGTDVVILHGDVQELRNPDRALTKFLSEASRKKYGYGPPPESYEKGGVSLLRPRKVLAWSQFPKDATRFTFSGR